MTKKIVLTGGPASGKTTMLSILKEEYGTDIEVAKEAATLVYSGGFPRNDTSKRYTYHAQRIIYTCTRELEDLATEINPSAKLILCDRGSLDGAVYWPYGEEDFLKVMGTDIQTEFDRYYAVIHMSPPNASLQSRSLYSSPRGSVFIHSSRRSSISSVHVALSICAVVNLF